MTVHSVYRSARKRLMVEEKARLARVIPERKIASTNGRAKRF